MPGLRRVVLACLVLGSLAACGEEEPKTLAEAGPEDLYNQGLSALDAGDYKGAALAFEEVERQHPYSALAPESQLLAAYSYYLENKYDDAIAAIDRYIELHPGADDIAYAYYLKGLCYYEQISDVGRDQEMTRLALQSMDEVQRRFPDSSYAREAKLKIDLARDHLAGKEMNVGRYYQRRGDFLAAINRYRVVVKDYQTTSQVPEALHRLIESYLALGIDGEAQATGAVLGYNFPGSEWYLDSYALLTGRNLRPEQQEGSWIGSVWPF